MATSRGPVQVTDNDPASINEALRQIVAWIDDISGLSDKTSILIGPHVHETTVALSGGPLTPPTIDPSTIDHALLADVTANQHHAQLHAAAHLDDGADEIALDTLGEPSDITDLNATTAAHGLLPKLSGNATDALLGDGTYGPVSGGSEANDVGGVDGATTEQIWEKISPHTEIVLTENSNGGNVFLERRCIGAKGYQSGAQAITNSVLTALTFPLEDFDTDAIHSTSTNTDAFVVPVDGKYLMVGNVSLAGYTGTNFYARITVNSTDICEQRMGALTGADSGTITAVKSLVAGDTVRFKVFQDSSGSVNTTGDIFCSGCIIFLGSNVAGLLPGVAFSPANISNIWAWYDASQEAYSNNDTTTSWTDWSGQSHPMPRYPSQGAQFKTNIINGKPIFRFSGVNDVMQYGSSITWTDPATICIVKKYTSGSDVFGYNTMARDNGSNFTMRDGTHTLTGPASDTTTFHKFIDIFKTAGSTMYMDGTPTTGSCNAMDNGAMWVGYSQAGLAWVGDIAEMIIVMGEMSATEITNLNAYWATKYAIAG